MYFSIEALMSYSQNIDVGGELSAETTGGQVLSSNSATRNQSIYCFERFYLLARVILFIDSNNCVY